VHEDLKGELIALLAVVLVLVIIFSGLYFYTGNWPPAVIVESKSMQHGNNFVFGVINTGDNDHNHSCPCYHNIGSRQLV